MRVCATIVAVEEQWLLHNLSVCICSLSYPACNAHAPYCRVTCPTLQYFSTLSHKRHDFRKKKRYWTQNVCFDFLYNIFLKHFSFWEGLREIWSKMYIGFHVKYPLFLSDCNDTWIFSTDLKKLHQNFMTILPVGAELFREDRRKNRRTNGRTERVRHNEADINPIYVYHPLC